LLTSNGTCNLYIIIEEDKKTQDKYTANEIFMQSKQSVRDDY
jgi:hypothetical protein